MKTVSIISGCLISKFRILRSSKHHL